MKVQIESPSITELIELVDKDHIDQALHMLDLEDARERFLEPWGPPQLCLIRIAARQGSLEILQRLYTLGANLHIADAFGSCALHHAALKGRDDVVRWFLERHAADRERIGMLSTAQLSFPDSSGSTALHEAIRGLHVGVVRLLVDAGALVDIQDKAGYTPLLMACFMADAYYRNYLSRFEKIVDILVSASAFVNTIHPETHMTPLHYAVKVNSVEAMKRLLAGGAWRIAHTSTDGCTPLHIAAKAGYHQLLDVLLEHLDPMMIDVKDKVGQTPLYVATIAGHVECIHALINKGGSLGCEAKNGLTVIDALFQRNERPIDFLTDLLDSGVHTTERDGNTVTLDFRVLAPQGKRQMAVVSALIRAVPSIAQMNILQHPLVEAFLGFKWTSLRYSFVILMIFQAIFVACLFVYGIILLQEKFDCATPRRMLLVCACILLCHNILQLLMIPKYYAKQFETWLSLNCATICVVVAVNGELISDSTDADYTKPLSIDRKYPPSWVLQSISIAILFACLQVMLLIGRFPTWGYYALMFSTVLQNVLKVFLAFVWIIIGFSLSFSILFHDNDHFGNPWKAFGKTVVMMMGEYEYTDIFPSSDNNEQNNSTINNSDSGKGQDALLPITSRIVFLIFIMIASIVLMNLMIGLAVSDVQGLLNEGLIRRLLKQAEFVSHLEQVTSHWIFRSRLVPRWLTKILESQNKISTQIDLGSSPRYGKRPRGISEKLVEKLFELASKNRRLHEKLQKASFHNTNSDSLTETIFYLQEGVKKLQREQMRIKAMQSPEPKIERRRRSTSY